MKPVENKKPLRIIFFLMLILSIMLTSCNSARTVSHEKYTSDQYLPSHEAVVLDASGVSPQKYSSSEEEFSILNQMELKMENEYLALYIGKYYDIAVLDKHTNKIFFSNRGAYRYMDNKKNQLSDEAKRLLYSQVSLEYADVGQHFSTLSSYPDCFQEENKVIVKSNSQQLLVKYIFGSDSKNKLIVPAFTVDTYQYYDKLMKKKIDDGEMNLIQYSDFANNYELVSYNKLDAIERKSYQERYPLIKKLGKIYVLKSNLSAVTEKKLTKMTKMLEITEKTIQQESEAIGGVKYYNTTPYFEIPVIYELQGRDFIVRIDTKNIKYNKGFYLTRVQLLQSFGATLPEEEGYLFVPEGSGMIIHNDTNVYKENSMDVPFYGPDFGIMHHNLETLEYGNTFPIFGAKMNHSAVFAIVENGEALGGVTAMTHNPHSDCNTISPYFHYFWYDQLNREGVALAFSNITPVTPYVVRYHFLYGDNASYSGMARYYQEYLLHTGVIKDKLEDNQMSMDIQLIGAITKKIKVAGVPMNRDVPVTTFKQAQAILNKMVSKSIGNISILYSGMINGGLDYSSPSKLKIEKSLGGHNGYLEFIRYAEQQDCDSFMDADITKIYKKGNAISSRKDFVRSLNKNSAVVSSFSPASNDARYDRMAVLVNPIRYRFVVDSFLGEYNKHYNKYLYLSSIGESLNSNFDEKDGLTREEVKVLTVRELKKFKDAGYQIKLDSGNVYALKFADSLTNVKLDSSSTRLEGQSVPFIGMVLKGYVNFTGMPLNQSRDYKKALLKVIENGAGLHYLLMDAEPLILTDTKYTDFYSSNADIWMDEIQSVYHKLNQDLGTLSSQCIIDHKQVKNDLFQVAYENGTKVFVNYSDTDMKLDNIEIKANDYTVVH